MFTSTLTGCPKNKKPAAAESSGSRDSGSAKTESMSPNHGQINGKSENANSSDLRVPESKLFLPFLVGAPKLTDCNACENVIDPGQEVFCSARNCDVSYHLSCARGRLSAKFKCPRHACFLCKKKYNLWKCSRCDLASHDKCAAYPEYIIRLDKQTWPIICWRHSTESPPLKPANPTNSIEEVFCRLPRSYVEEEFRIDINNMWKAIMADTIKPPPYVDLRHNIYLVKKKRDDVDDKIGCAASCEWEICNNDCMCRRLRISCSSACRCLGICTNRPFNKKEKKIKIVMTRLCGWGVEAAEYIEKGDFIIEYVGEIISDDVREERFWDLKNKGVTKFYMCEVRKDFTIDATSKGNASRFMNHSCDPNCNLEKWVVNGETRLGVFAARSIELGEPLTYDYQFVQFGQEVECHCGASNCQGSLGTKKKLPKLQWVDWGTRGRRTAIANVPRNKLQLADWGVKGRRTAIANVRRNN